MFIFKNFFKKHIDVSITSISFNGFNFNYTTEEYSAIRKGRYDIITIQNYFRILKDCGKLINTTKNPDIFFKRYLTALAILNDLILVENRLSFKGNKPSKIKKQLQEKEIYTVNDFLDRYYQDTLDKINKLKTSKAKQNKVVMFSNKIDTYSIYMTNESLKKFTLMYEELKKYTD